MAAASSGPGDVMVVDEREAEGEVRVDRESEKSGLGSEKGGTPPEGTEEHMKIVEVRSTCADATSGCLCAVYVLPPAQRHLDELTFSGSAVNDLELQLGRERALYRQTLVECKAHLEETRRRLGACITKSEPFIDVWRRARQVEQLSHRYYDRY